MSEALKTNGLFLLQCLAALWVIELLNTVLGHRFNAWGILPRTLWGLVGIPLSPFLHASVFHMLMNTLPCALLGGMVLLQGRRVFLEVSLFVILLGGAGVWLFGRTAVHVGASGVIFGYFGYLVARGWYSRSPGALLLAIATGVLYSSMIWGVVPTRLPISWEAHLCGLIAGVLAARLAGTDVQETQIPEHFPVR